MHVKCVAVAKAQQVHEELPSGDDVSFNALIVGYAQQYTQQAQGEQALNYFGLMQHEGFYPNAVTFACSIGACNKGEEGTAVVDIYAKCGDLAKEHEALEEFPPGEPLVSASLQIN